AAAAGRPAVRVRFSCPPSQCCTDSPHPRAVVRVRIVVGLLGICRLVLLHLGPAVRLGLGVARPDLPRCPHLVGQLLQLPAGRRRRRRRPCWRRRRRRRQWQQRQPWWRTASSRRRAYWKVAAFGRPRPRPLSPVRPPCSRRRVEPGTVLTAPTARRLAQRRRLRRPLPRPATAPATAAAAAARAARRPAGAVGHRGASPHHAAAATAATGRRTRGPRRRRRHRIRLGPCGGRRRRRRRPGPVDLLVRHHHR
ncbi:hypothetical protein HK405_002546, partial [Cladochytrium tenue]